MLIWTAVERETEREKETFERPYMARLVLRRCRFDHCARTLFARWTGDVTLFTPRSLSSGRGGKSGEPVVDCAMRRQVFPAT